MSPVNRNKHNAVHLLYLFLSISCSLLNFTVTTNSNINNKPILINKLIMNSTEV